MKDRDRNRKIERQDRDRDKEREAPKNKNDIVQEQKRIEYWKLPSMLIFTLILTHTKSILILIHILGKKPEFLTFKFKLRCLS